MYWLTYAKSVRGRREVNQDDFATFQSRGVKVMIVCDGNGGVFGEKFSEAILKSCLGEVSYALPRMGKINIEGLQTLSLAAVGKVSEHAGMLKRCNPELAACGTTITLVLIYNSAVVASWVGDSPAIVYQSGKITKLTNPLHNLKEMLINGGEDKESVSKQDIGSVLMRCIGHRECEPDFRILEMKPPFLVLVASDGIADLPEKSMVEIIRRNLFEGSLPDKLIGASLEYGSDDNITVVSTLCMEMRNKLKKIKRLYWKRRRLIC